MSNEREFKKSSYSSYADCHCVEVSISESNVLVRHSITNNPIIQYSREEWDAFIKGVKSGEFDL